MGLCLNVSPIDLVDLREHSNVRFGNQDACRSAGAGVTIRRKFLKGGLILSAGQVLSQGMSVIRNILIARLIVTEADFGIASTLILVVGLNEMLSNIATNTLILQDKDGDDLQFVNVIHFASAMRGLFGSITFLVFAYPMAFLFGVKEASWAFVGLAAVPLLRGLIHHDIYRFQRHFLFFPAAIQETLGQLVTLLVCVPLLQIFRDYSAVLYILIIQTAAATLFSHLVAEYPYRWAHNRDIERRILSFGIPLLFNGIFMFGIMQGERFAIGSSGRVFDAARYSMEDMAAYSAAVMIASLVPQFLSRVFGGLFMPALSGEEGNSFIRRNSLCIHACVLSAGLVAIPLIVFSHEIIRIVYGGRYSNAGNIVACVAFAQALYMLRVGGNVALLARGYTWDAFINNLWRSITLPGILMVTAAGLPLVWIAIPAIVGESVAIIALAGQTWKRCSIPVSDLLKPFTLLFCGLAAASLFPLFWSHEPQSLVHFAAGFMVWGGFLCTWIVLFPSGFSSVRKLLNFSANRSEVRADVNN